MANRGIVYLPSYHEAIRNLADSERLLMYDAILDYGLNYVEPGNLPPMLKGFFTLIRPSLDASRNRYAAAVENGKKGGRPSTNAGENQSEKPNDNQSENEKSKPSRNQDKAKETDMDMDISLPDKPARSRFVPPSLYDVKDFCKENDIRINAEAFYDHYVGNGWMAGRVKMRDWMATLRNWERRDKANLETPQESKKPKTRFERRIVDGEEVDVEVLLRD